MPTQYITIVAAAGQILKLDNGNYIIDASAGDVTVIAGNGNDTIIGGAGDVITLGNGNDTVLGGSSETIKLGNGSDTVSVGDLSTIAAGNGTDTITAGSGSSIIAGNGNDTIKVGHNSSITVGNGHDVLTIGANSAISAGSGADTISAGPASTISAGKTTGSLSTPTINGVAREGQTLTASASSAQPISYAWYSSADNYTTPIGTGATYRVNEADEGSTLEVKATVALGNGHGPIITETSVATAAVLDAAPTITTPTITGTVQEGQTLTASASSGQGDNAVTYEWYSSANNYVAPIATGSTYQLSEADEGFIIEVQATATNGNGLAVSAFSAATGPVLDAAPTITTPTITGTAQEGETLTASASSGQSDNPVTYQWFSSADNYTSTIGNGPTYQVEEKDEGFTIEAEAIATNDDGKLATAASAPAAVVIDAAPAIVPGGTIASGNLTEDKRGHEEGDETATGTIAFTDADPTHTHGVSQSAPVVTWSGGMLSTTQQAALAAASELTLTEADSTGSGSGTVAWSYTIPDSAIDFLAQGETLTAAYHVAITDNEGGTVSQDVDITIMGANEAPVLAPLSGGTQTFDRTNGLALSGTLTFSDVDLTDAHIVSVLPLGASYVGTVAASITTDSTGTGHGAITASYTLTPAQYMAASGIVPAEQDYRITISDQHGGTASQVLQIPLQQILNKVTGGGGGGGGGSDQPPIFTYSSAAALPGGSASVWDDPAASILDTSGFFQFDDPDPNDTHQLQVTPASGNWGNLLPILENEPSSSSSGNILWQYAVDEPLARPLAAGETHLDQFTFKVTDSAGLSTSATLSVVINGADEAPILEGSGTTTIQGSPSDLANLAGSFGFGDADLSDTHSLSYQPTPNTLGGSFSASIVNDTTNGTGGEVDWTYSPNASTLQALGEGESISETIPVTISGNLDALKALGAPVTGPGMSATEYIELAAYGVNDAPYFRDAPVSLTESPIAGSTDAFQFSGNIDFGDPDTNDTHLAYVLFDPTLSSTSAEVGHLDAVVSNDTTGGLNADGLIHWTYDLPTSAFADTTPAHQVYDIGLQDNHGLQSVQAFTVDVFPHA